MGATAALAEDPVHEQVLVLHSFGHDVSPYVAAAAAFEEELSRISPRPVEFFQASLESARFSEASNEAPLVNYLDALFSQQRLDLIVFVGGPASRFAIRQRDRLFPQTPLLAAGVERRWVENLEEARNAVAAPVDLDLSAAIENVLRLLPDTEEIVVVLGDSPNDRLWRAETEREFQRFAQVRFVWTNDWTLPEMETRLAKLPPRSAIFFGDLSVDARRAPLPHQYGARQASSGGQRSDLRFVRDPARTGHRGGAASVSLGIGQVRGFDRAPDSRGQSDEHDAHRARQNGPPGL